MRNGWKGMVQGKRDIMKFVHISIRTDDMDRSIGFYETYLGMRLEKRKEIASNNAEIAFLGCENTSFKLEITWYKD